jgi:hypothetical protein
MFKDTLERSGMKKRGIVAKMVMVTGFLALLAPLILGGCAQPQHWTKKGLNQTEFDQDAARCRREASQATYPDPYGHDAGQSLERSVGQEKFFEQCLAAKGYRLERSEPRE